MKTNPGEFQAFHSALMNNAPSGYIPWYFPVIADNKAPDGIEIAKRSPENVKGKRGNWKADWARLTYEESRLRICQGKNVGIAARANDELIIIDIDEYNYLQCMPNTLVCTSRKRCGEHGFCWKAEGEQKRNIPTDFGEVRSSDQYVVVAGSYCSTSEKDIDKENIPVELKEKIKQSPQLGLYSVKQYKSPITLLFKNLPSFFLDQERGVKEKPVIKTTTIKPSGKHSAIFDLQIGSIVSCNRNARVPHPLHSSDTGMNFSIENDLGHCWRHNVSLNALQFLAVKSGYMRCQDAGTGHKNSGAGSSDVSGNDGAIFHAWLEAKKCNLIPKDDPVPVRALHYIAKKNDLIKQIDGYKLPIRILNQVLTIIEEDY